MHLLSLSAEYRANMSRMCLSILLPSTKGKPYPALGACREMLTAHVHPYLPLNLIEYRAPQE